MRGGWSKLWRNPAILMLHISFLVIIAGALLTWLTQQKGYLRLTAGEEVTEFRVTGGRLLPLPETMELDSFRVEYYPGNTIPKDYKSYLHVGERPCVVSMNNVLEIHGYRFCQADYDYDGSSVLAVNHDPWGEKVVYAGFALFALAGLWVLLSPRCRWRTIMRSLALMAILFLPESISAAGMPSDGNGQQSALELVYGRISFPALISILLFAGALLSFLALSGNYRLRRGSSFALWSAWILSALCLAMQWILSGHIPLSNTYETLLFAVWILELLIALGCRRDMMLQGIAMTFAAALALVAFLVEEKSGNTHLMPVLNSPWLSIHVSLVMTSYALLGLTFVAAATALLSPSRAPRMQRISLAALYPAQWLLGLGIITGSIWANISWGRYWSWDPKETLALVTFLVYALPLHGNLAIIRTPRRFHIYMLLAILSVAMTYFGVNLLPSLHSYN